MEEYGRTIHAPALAGLVANLGPVGAKPLVSDDEPAAMFEHTTGALAVIVLPVGDGSQHIAVAQEGAEMIPVPYYVGTPENTGVLHVHYSRIVRTLTTSWVDAGAYGLYDTLPELFPYPEPE